MEPIHRASRTVLITGGSRGIGAACVRAFTRAGDRVVFFYRSRKEEAERLAAETGALALCADVSDPASVTSAVQTAREALGPISVLVNNAGIAHIGLFSDMSVPEWNTVIGTNLSGAAFVTSAVVPDMVREKYGRIVNIGSMWGKIGASCEVAYSASKAGIRGFTMALAKELGPSGITVNCVEPGVIDTEMNRSLDEETRTLLAEETPLCRIGTPEEVAEAVIFLSSGEASFITGQILGVDGGFAIG
ncbi:MAG: 3-oxoacyl-ACP reductase FabG [Clostridia bacterium]|nr:3-oxoacyl-ACP reductase FabG [Clostridia bacterium]